MLTRTVPTVSSSRRAGGFTLVEVATVTLVAGILFLLLAQWVGSLLSVSTSGLDVNGAQRDVAYAVDTFRNDAETANGCDPYGLDGPLRQFSRQELWFHADVVDAEGDPTPDGNTDVVTWRQRTVGDAATIERAVVPGTGTCDFDMADPDWRVLVDNVDISNQALFVGYKNGKERTEDADYGACTGMEAERCLYESIQLRFVLRSSGEDEVPISSVTLIPLNLASSRLT